MKKELRILIIEDVPADAELEEHELRKAGLIFTSKVVDTREAFLKALDEFSPDLILSDYDLPSFDGLAALRIAQEKCPDVPFILVTGKLGEEFVIDKLKDGATDYVLKGNLKRLVPAVKRALEEAKQIRERKRAEEALKKNENKFRSLFNNTSDAIAIHDMKGHFFEVNDTLCNRLGYSREELLHMTPLDIDTEENSNLVQKRINTLKTQGYLTFETAHVSRDGKVIPVEVYSRIIDYEGEEAVLSVARDVTERKKAEKAMLKSEERFRDLYDNAPDMYHTLDENGIIVDCNETEAKMLGYKKEEIIGRHVTDFFAEKSKRLFYLDFPPLEQKKSLRNIEREFSRKDGTIFPASLNVFFEYDENGKFKGTKTISRDITERKQTEKIMERKSEEQELLLDNIQTLIWYLKDVETQGIVNKACADFFGKKKEDLENKKLHDVMSKEEVEICIAGNKEVFEKKVTIHTEEWAKNAKGEKRLIAITKTPKIDENGNVEYVVCSAEEITERKQAEEKIKEKMDEITRINKLFIGREHRIIEIKREVNTLLERLGQSKKYEISDHVKEKVGNQVSEEKIGT